MSQASQLRERERERERRGPAGERRPADQFLSRESPQVSEPPAPWLSPAADRGARGAAGLNPDPCLKLCCVCQGGKPRVPSASPNEREQSAPASHEAHFQSVTPYDASFRSNRACPSAIRLHGPKREGKDAMGRYTGRTPEAR